MAAPAAATPLTSKLAGFIADPKFEKNVDLFVTGGIVHARFIMGKCVTWSKSSPTLTDDELRAKVLGDCEMRRLMLGRRGIADKDVTSMTTVLELLAAHDIITTEEMEAEQGKWLAAWVSGEDEPHLSARDKMLQEQLKKPYQHIWENWLKDHPPLVDPKETAALERDFAYSLRQGEVPTEFAALIIALLHPDAGERARVARLMFDTATIPYGYITSISFQKPEHEPMRRRIAEHLRTLQFPILPDSEIYAPINAELMRVLESQQEGPAPAGGGERPSAAKVKFFAKADRDLRRKRAPFLNELPGEGPTGGDPVSYVVRLQQNEVGDYDLDLSRVASALGGLWDGMMEMRTFLQVVGDNNNEQLGKILAKASARAQSAPPKQQQQQRSRKPDPAQRNDGSFTGRASQPAGQRTGSRSRSAEPRPAGRGRGRGF